MIIREILAKNIITRSRVYEYTLNPYAGCQHACTYCYARFMLRYSRHSEPWGGYLDVKINAADLLLKELPGKKPGRVWVSGVCDPYQPAEKKYELTQKCLEILFHSGWPVTIQTRSPLVLRDLELLKSSRRLEVGLTVTTADDSVRKLFEPSAPPVLERVQAVRRLHEAGILTFVMIAPLLPGAEDLPALLNAHVDRVLIDRLNYHYADWVCRKYKLESYFTPEAFSRLSREICSGFAAQGIDCRIL
jgi:DNA repair photolyase